MLAWQELAIFHFLVLAQLHLHVPLGKQGTSEKVVSSLAPCQTISVFVFLLITHLKHTFVSVFFFLTLVFAPFLYGERPCGCKEK